MRRSQPWQTNRSRVLRANSPSAEKVLWARLRNRQIDGHKFVRQLPIGPYFADFACRNLMLVIEIDGETHHTDAQLSHDHVREAHLRDAGFHVIRFANSHVYDELEGVLRTIAEACTEQHTALKE
jgi:very-short-patch-repair endonuclease